MFDQLQKALSRAEDDDFALIFESRLAGHDSLRRFVSAETAAKQLSLLPEKTVKETLNGLAILSEETASHMEVLLFAHKMSHYFIVEPKQNAR